MGIRGVISKRYLQYVVSGYDVCLRAHVCIVHVIYISFHMKISISKFQNSKVKKHDLIHTSWRISSEQCSFLLSLWCLAGKATWTYASFLCSKEECWWGRGVKIWCHSLQLSTIMFYLAVSIQMLPPQYAVPYAIVPVSKQVSKGFPVCTCFCVWATKELRSSAIFYWYGRQRRNLMKLSKLWINYELE